VNTRSPDGEILRPGEGREVVSRLAAKASGSEIHTATARSRFSAGVKRSAGGYFSG